MAAVSRLFVASGIAFALVANSDAETASSRLNGAASRASEIDPPSARATDAPACAAPSLVKMREKEDATDLDVLASCTWSDPYLMTSEREQPVAARCGLAPYTRDVDLARLEEAAMPLDDATRAHVRAIFERGKARGRKDFAVGVVGDSMSLERAFLRPFREGTDEDVRVDGAVKDALTFADGRTVIDVFRRSFDAPRAAKVGAKADWALTKDARGETPVSRMIADVSPAFAVVLYGTNDAADTIAPPEAMARELEENLGRIVDTLEGEGIVPILSTIPKHMRDRRYADCPVKGTEKSNLRYAVQTNALSAAAAGLACTRHLPLVDLRYAIDPLLDHGVGKDGVHPSRYFRGGGVLDDHGLQCGYNARNFVTLRMLKQVRDAVLP